jgi:GDP-L-fucose synthase
MRVTVTGGTGFFGRHIVNELKEHGHKVFAPSHADCNLLDAEDRRRLLCYPADAVIHCAAAVGGIGANVAEPGRFFYENAVMGMELMELARKRGIEKFITIGTSCEYPESAPQPLNETTLWDGYPTPATARYGVAKRMLLEMGQAYREQYGFNAIHLLPTNLYGPGDSFNLSTGHVIPSLVRKFVEAADLKKPGVTCWGTGKATRDFIYVTDAARAVRLALETYDSPEALNIGSGAEYSIESIAELVAGSAGFGGGIFWDASRPEGVSRRVMDTANTEKALGFKANVDLPSGIETTVSWYRSSISL